MTPDQSFARWVHVSLAAFIVLFVYFLIADIWMPVTPQSRVMHPVVQLTPQVSGHVMQVHVTDNQHVRAGDLLFSLDQRPYQLSVDRARISLAQAGAQNEQLDAGIAAAEASWLAAKVDVADLSRELQRMRSLAAKHSVSEQQLDRSKAQHQAAAARASAAEAKVQQLQAQRGDSGDTNLAVREASNVLARAQLDLGYSQVRAETDGIISNLQVTPGVYAKAGFVMAALVADSADIIADFREKSLSQAVPGDRAAIVFDSLPGQVFPAAIAAVDAGTRAGQLTADGTLAAPESTDRWVRDAQRQRVHLTLSDSGNTMLERMPSGSRATVQLYPADGLPAWLGALQIRLISLIHYIY